MSYAIRMIDEVTMPILIRILRKKSGIVILVGKAARLVTRAIPMFAIASINKYKLLPVKITTVTVSGVRIHPCAAKMTPNHNNLDSSWDLHQFRNLFSTEGADFFSV